jgi:hypothetical protein
MCLGASTEICLVLSDERFERPSTIVLGDTAILAALVVDEVERDASNRFTGSGLLGVGARDARYGEALLGRRAASLDSPLGCARVLTPERDTSAVPVQCLNATQLALCPVVRTRS